MELTRTTLSRRATIHIMMVVYGENKVLMRCTHVLVCLVSAPRGTYT